MRKLFHGDESRAAAAAVALLLAVNVVACRAPSNPSASDLVSVPGLGSLSFLNSGNVTAQDSFVRGVLLLHSFEYEQAAEAFRAAQEADPGFVLAYWGEAMTYNHPLWRQKDREAAFETLARLAPTAAERRAKAATEREAMYLDAVEALYRDAPKAEADRDYMEAMRRLQESYPDDMEARAFYALSILGTRNGERDFATYMRAAATAQPVFDANPRHPGAAHYLIHSFDDPVHAPLGLPAARAYSEIAPNAAHAQHMTTHIFVALGMWDDVVKGNIRAMETQDADRVSRGRPPNVCGHYSSWLHYGRLQLGEDEEARKLMDACHARMSEDPDDGERYYFVSMRARQIVDMGDWSLRERWLADLPEEEPGDSPSSVRDRLSYDLTNAFAALRDGNPGPANALVAATTPASEAERLQLDEVRGLLALAEGREGKGIELLQAAAAAEDALPFEFGPPGLVKPTFELLGEELFRLGRMDEARAAYRRAAERTPGRVLAEKGARGEIASAGG